MAQGEIKIRIGAVQDRSVDTVFGNVEKRAQKARDNINRALGGSGGSNAIGGPLANMGRQADAAARQADKAWAGQLKALNNYARLQDREYRRSEQDKIRAVATANRSILRDQITSNRARVKDEQETSRAIVREFKKQVKEREQGIKSQLREEVRTRRNFAERTSHRATRFLFPPPEGIVGAAGRIGGDILRGAGIDTTIQGSVSRVVALSAQLSRLRNQSVMNGNPVERSALEGSVKGAADRYGYDRGDAASALAAFSDRTGDMQLGVDVLPKLAERAAATGTSLEDMLSAAGEVALNLGPVKDKAKALVGVLDTWVAQGGKGAIEIKHLAQSGAARLAANAGRFEGDASENMKELGAFAQIARQKGGAATPAEAAVAVARMTDQFTTAARVKAFKKEGVDVLSATEKGKLKRARTTIKEALLATDGDPMKMKKLVMSSIAAKAVTPLAQAYTAAGGGKKGTDAVDKMIDEFMATADIQEKLNQANAERDQEVATKAKKFQAKLDDVTQKLAAKLFPTLEKLEEPALKLAGALADLVGWAAENPWKAVATGIGAAVGRAMLESAMRSSIDRAIMGAGNGLLPGRGIAPNGMPLPGGGGVWAGRMGTGLMALGAGATGYALGGALGGAMGGAGGAQSGSLIAGGALAGATLGGPLGAMIGASVGGVTDQAMDLGKVTEGWGGFGALLTGGFSGLDEYQNKTARARRASADAEAAGAGSAQGAVESADIARGVADGMSAKTLQVKVVNAKDFSTPAATGPVVPAAGRAPAHPR